MALKKRLVPILFNQGVDNKTFPDSLLMPAFKSLINLEYTQDNALSPRKGWALEHTFIPSATPETPRFLATSSTKVSMGLGKRIFSGDLNSFISNNTIIQSKNTRERGMKTPVRACRSHSIAQNSQFICQVFLSANNSSLAIGLKIVDKTTFQTVIHDVVIKASQDNNVSTINVVCVDDIFYITYVNTSGNLSMLRVNIPTEATTSIGSVVTDMTLAGTVPVLSAAGIFSTVSLGSSPAYFAYISNANTTRAVKITISGLTATFGTSVLVGALATTQTIAMATCTRLGGVVAIASATVIAGTLNWEIAYLDSNLTLVSLDSFSAGGAGTALQITLSPASNNPAIVIAHVLLTLSGGPPIRLASTSTRSGAGIVTFTNVPNAVPYTGGYGDIDSHEAICDAFTTPTYGSQVFAKLTDTAYMNGVIASDSNIGHAAAPLASYVPIGQPANPIAFGDWVVYSCPVVSGTESLTSITPGTDGIQNAVDLVPEVSATLVFRNLSTKLTTVSSPKSNDLIINSSAFHSSSIRYPANIYPELPVQLGDLAVTSAGSEGAGIVSFVFALVLEAPDGSVVRRYSSVFIANLSASKRIQYNISANTSILIDSQIHPHRIEMYRTERNGQVLYKSGDILPNLGWVFPSTFTDTMSDINLIRQRLADINGDAIPPGPIPSIVTGTMYKGGVVVVPSEDPYSIYYEAAQGVSDAPNTTVFAPGISTRFPEEGPIEHLCQMDSALYIFKKKGVWTQYGDVPGITGANGTLTTPQKIFNGIGVNSDCPPVLTKDGIMLHTGDGFYLILRNQQLIDIGSGPYSNATSLVSMITDADQIKVYCLFSNSDLWLYDLQRRAWSQLTAPNNCGAIASDQHKIWALTPTVLASLSTPYDDQTAAGVASTVFHTGWLELGGIMGYQRVRKIFIQGKHTLLGPEPVIMTVDVYVDNKALPVQSIPFTVPITQTDMELEIRPEIQKCKKLAIKVTTLTHDVTWTGMSLEVGVKVGMNKNRYVSSSERG